jgi:hypothetical protein
VLCVASNVSLIVTIKTKGRTVEHTFTVGKGGEGTHNKTVDYIVQCYSEE